MTLPKMLPCQHTFCLQCLNNQFENTTDEGNFITCPVCELKATNIVSDELPTNLYIESVLKVMEKSNKMNISPKSPTVRFAPLPEEINEKSSVLNPQTKCHLCKTSRKNESRCKHCRQMFCQNCWLSHIEDLKGQLKHIHDHLNSTTRKFDNKIEDFRNRIDEAKEFINKDIEQRIAELREEQEDRIKRADEMAAVVEMSAEDIKRRIHKTRHDIEEHKEELFDSLSDNQEKVRAFLNFQQRATELEATVSIWESETSNGELICNGKRVSELETSNEDPKAFYRQRSFKAKTIANRDVVQRPSALAIDPWRDHVIVACPASGQVVILDKKYKVVRRIHHQDMMAPQGVVFVQETEEIFVTDKWKHCIFVFNRNGELIRRICSKGQRESQLRSPEGMALHPKLNTLYVADTGNDRVQIMRRDGTYIGSIGPTDRYTMNITKSGKVTNIVVNQLNQPTDVVVSLLNVVVADCGNHKVKVFDHDGQILHTIGGLGVRRGLFKSPEVVDIDNMGCIIVGDAGNGRVQIFSSNGEFLQVLGGNGGKTKPFEWVSGILMHNNRIFISDSKSNTIQAF
ncbi:hypothetical protein KM043_012812 [Ampulex compressa]|nr:hypothetical protein KM043_012812 [Ampulex compressa]